jgi:hypothetical protein
MCPLGGGFGGLHLDSSGLHPMHLFHWLVFLYLFSVINHSHEYDCAESCGCSSQLTNLAVVLGNRETSSSCHHLMSAIFKSMC